MAEFQRESKTFSQVLDFTRGSTGTYFDASGVLQTSAVDDPRFTHDPDTLEAQGLLIEEQRTNLLLWSEEFDNAAWVKNRISVTANASTAPDGGLAADKIIPNTEDNSHFITKSFSAISGAATYTIHAKSGEYSAIRINSGSSGNGFATFDLALGVVSTSSGTFFTNADIENIGDGWYRCRLVLTDTPGEIFTIAIENPVGDLVFAGDGTSGLYVWGAQLEEGTFPTSYIKTEGSQVTRSAGSCTRTLGSEFNPSEGTFIFEGSFDNPGALANYAFDTDSGAGSDRIAILADNSGQLNFFTDGTETESLTPAGAVISFFANNKIAISYSEATGVKVGALNGTSYAGAFSGGASPTTLYVGARYSIDEMGARCRSIRYYPRALSATELQELTA